MARRGQDVAVDFILPLYRRAYFPETGGWVDCPVYDRYKLAAGLEIAGPAIVEECESTSVLPPGVVATVDEYANLLVEVAPR